MQVKLKHQGTRYFPYIRKKLGRRNYLPLIDESGVVEFDNLSEALKYLNQKYENPIISIEKDKE